MEKSVITYLLVEDEEKECKDYRRYSALHEEFICLDMVDNVDDAIDRTRKLRPQAVILDLQLNESDGEDYLVRINKLNLKDTERPYILVLTNNTVLEDYAEVTRLGARRVICKAGSRYQNEQRGGPQFVYEFLLQKRHLFGVKLNPARTLPVPYETKEEMCERIKEFCYEYGAGRNSHYTDYTAHTIAAIKTHGKGTFILKSLIQETVCPDFNGVDEHAIYVGVRFCIEHMWDSGLQREYEERYYTSAEKGGPKPMDLLIYLAEQF